MRLWLLRLMLRTVERRLFDAEYELLLFRERVIVLLPGELRWLRREIPALRARRAALSDRIAAMSEAQVEGQMRRAA